MRYAEVMKDTETAAPEFETVLFLTGKEASIIAAALSEYAEHHKRKRAARILSKWFNNNVIVE